MATTLTPLGLLSPLLAWTAFSASALTAAPGPLELQLAPAVTAPVQESGDLVPEVEYTSSEEASGAAQEAMRSGNFERAREILGQVVMLEHFREARAKLADDNPAGALSSLDRALDIAPRDLALRTYRAEGLLSLATQAFANGGSGVFVGSAFEDAAKAFAGLPETPRSLMGGAQSLIMLNRSAEALPLAERAAANTPNLAQLDFSFGDGIEILARASYLEFAERADAVRNADPEADPEALGAAYARALDHTARFVAARPEQASAWNTAANIELYQSAATGDAAHTELALTALREGLAAIPAEPTLLGALVRVANEFGGPDRAVAELQNLAAVSGDEAPVAMELGKQRFFAAVASFPQEQSTDPAAYAATRARFAAAQADFAAVRTMEASADLGAGAWEIISQTGEGWAELFAGNYEAAVAEFLATEELAAGGLLTDYSGYLQSGMRGLQTVLARYAAAGAQGDGAALGNAAQLASKIFEFDPEAADAANNAGFFNRDAAVALENEARAFCSAAGGLAPEEQISELRRRAEIAPELYGTEAEKRQFRERANALMERARVTMRTSADAYLRAAELAPEDARVQNDTGLVFVHYLHTDLDAAEAFLREAVRLGEAQLAEADPEAEGFTALTEAYGDAHENLGVLHLEFLEQPEAARNYFERSVEIGPYERPIVTRYYLPRIDGETDLPLSSPVTAWGKPCE